MSLLQLLLLGAIAGLTVYLGLPVALLRHLSLRSRGALNGVATGILVFLTIEILSKVLESGERALESWSTGAGSLLSLLTLLGLSAGGLTLGLVSIPLLELRLLRRWTRPAPLGIVAQATRLPSQARSAAELQPHALALMIAAGIGLHNFSEGLAIGQSAAAGAVPLALLLIIGFALQNITEGFGIAAPLAGERPSLKFLLLAGLIAGGPTFLGTLVGASWSSEPASIVFLSLSGGALLYVIAEFFRLGHAMLAKVPFMLSVAGGFLLSYLTELVLVLTLGG